MIKKLAAYIGRREMLKNMALLTGGTAIAQAIGFGVSPILSRLFTDNDYGEYGIFTSIVSYLVVVSCLRLEQAIVIPKSDDEARSIAQWSIKLNTIVALLTFGICCFGLVLFEFSPFFILIGPTVFFMGLINTFNYYSTRQKTYKINSQSRIITSIAIAATAVLMGFLNSGSAGLIIGMLLGQVFGGIYLFVKIYKEIYKSSNSLAWSELRKKYKQFIFINTPHALFDLTEVYGVILLMGFFFEDSFIGAYFFAFRILKAPIGLIGSSIFQVFYRESSARVADKIGLLKLFKKLVMQLTAFSFVPFLVLGLFGEELFLFVFGNDWGEAGVISSFFALWFWLNFIANPVSCIPIIMNKQPFSFAIAVFNTIIRLTIIFIAGLEGDFYILIYGFAISQALIMLFNLLWYYYLVIKHENSLQIA